MSRNWLLSAAAACALSCANADPADVEEETGEARDAFVARTPVQQIDLPGGLVYWNAPFAGNTALAAAYSSGPGQRYVFSYRSHGAPYDVSYFLVDGQQGSPTFGQATTVPTVTNCGGTPCRELNHPSGASLYVNSSTDYAWITYAESLYDNGVGFSGHTKLKTIRFAASGSHTAFTLKDCAGGGVPNCKIKWPSSASSQRHDGTDRVLVAYNLQQNLGVNDWDIGAVLVAPNGAVTTLTSVDGCSTPPCVMPSGGAMPPTGVAYNAQVNQFLVAWVQWANGYNPRVMAQRYDGTTGALLGGKINLGIPVVTGNFQNFIGVTSHPDPSVNPNSQWVIFAENTRYHVLPNGSFSTGSLPGSDGLANYTLQWTDAASDNFGYERLFDFAQSSGIAAQRFNSSVAGATGFGVENGGLTGWTENLAFGRGNHSMAAWSGGTCGLVGGVYVCVPFVRFRLIDH